MKLQNQQNVEIEQKKWKGIKVDSLYNKVKLKDKRTLKPLLRPNHFWRLFLRVKTKDLILEMMETTQMEN